MECLPGILTTKVANDTKVDRASNPKISFVRALRTSGAVCANFAIYANSGHPRNIHDEDIEVHPRPSSFPLTGKDKGRGDWFDLLPSTPIPTFPHQGERRSQRYVCIMSLRASVSP